jgi:hypothetical protein
MRDDSSYWWVVKTDGEDYWAIAQRGDPVFRRADWTQRVSRQRHRAEHVRDVYNRKVESRRSRGR